MKKKTTSLNLYVFITAFISTIAVTSIIIGLIYLDDIIDTQIAKQIPIKNGTDSYTKWQKLAVPLTIKFYLFNITNSINVIYYGEKPKLQQVGPYTFIETREKNQIRFKGNGAEVIYKEYKYYIHDKSKTNGSLDDVITVPNIPEITLASQIISKAEEIPTLATFLYGLLNTIFQSSATNIFSQKRVREMLFEGYKVRALDELESFLKGIPNNPVPFKSPLKNNIFGLFYLKNGSSDPEALDWRVNTGLFDATKFGQVISYDDKKQNKCWRNSYYCNSMFGTDGSQFPPNLDLPKTYKEELLKFISLTNKIFDFDIDLYSNPEYNINDISGKKRLYVYNPEICRNIYLTYERESFVKGIKSYRYTLPDIFYTSPADAIENACYCTKAKIFDLKEFNKKFILEHMYNVKNRKNFIELKNAYKNSFPPQCRLNGILDISRCKKAPIIISAPHFYKADALLVHSVEGLEPNAKLHKTYVDIEPRTGIVINAARRVQINIELIPHNNVAPFRSLHQVISNINNNYNNYHSSNSFNNYNGLILPVLWLEETASIDEPNANLLKTKLINKIIMYNGILIFLLNLAILCLTISIVYLLFVTYVRINKNSEADELPKKKPIN